MPAKFQDWFTKNIWATGEKRGTSSSDTINGKFWDYFMQDGFETVPVSQAQKISAVYTCLNVRSQTVAALPINIYRESKGEKITLTDHPAYYPLAHQPNSYMSSANMFLASMLHADSEGNSYLRIYRDGKNRPNGFEIMLPLDVSVTSVEGSAFYNWKGEIIPGRNVLHFRWFSLNGLHGISPIRMNAMTMSMAKKLDKYAGLALGDRPPGYLSYDGVLKPEQLAQSQESWMNDRARGKTPVLSGNWKYNGVMISPGDAEYILSRELTKRDIYGIWRVPPIFAQDYERATFANAEQSDLIFAKHTISPIVRLIEQECNLKLFTEEEKTNTYVKMNLNGLLRGDLQARQGFYSVMNNIGAMNANEVRSLEDQNPYKGGEIYTKQAANIPVDMLREFYSTKLAPSVEPGGGKPKKMNGIEHPEFTEN